MGRQSSNTKLGKTKVVKVSCRGSIHKYRALKLNEGNFHWISQGISRKCKILEVVYNASNNELVRTNTLVKNTIVTIDPTPFKYYWYVHFTEVKISKLPEMTDPKRKQALEEKKNKLQKTHPKNNQLDKLSKVFELINKGRVYACITTRPGQVGKADGYILEGPELEFYLKKLEKK